MQIVNQALSVGKKRGVSKEGFIQMTDKIQNQMKNKAEEKREIVRPAEPTPATPAPAPSTETQPASEPVR